VYNGYEATDSGTDGVPINLPDLKEYVVIDEADKRVEYNTYYRPRHKNFPAIDSWVLIRPDPKKPPIFIMFQITITTSTHDVKQEGLDRMDQLQVPKDALRWLVIFTPKEAQPRIGPVMKSYVKKREAEIKAAQNGSSNTRKRKREAPTAAPRDTASGVFHYPIDSDTVFTGDTASVPRRRVRIWNRLVNWKK